MLLTRVLQFLILAIGAIIPFGGFFVFAFLFFYIICLLFLFLNKKIDLKEKIGTVLASILLFILMIYLQT